MDSRHILFYSNHCVFSRQLLADIATHGIRELFILVCIDARTDQLPDFVDRVPLVLTLDRRVLTDDAAFAFAAGLAAVAPAGTGGTEDAAVSPWSTVEMGSRGLSDKFSFLEHDAGYGHNFVDVSSNPTIHTPDESPGKPSKTPSLESYIAMRDNDIKPFLGQRASPP